MLKIKTAIGRSKQQESVQNFATKRLMRDLQQIKKEPLPGISALPLEHDLFTWHCNIMGPKDTVWQGGIFHIVMHFTQDYPNSPPSLTLCTRIEHPNVIGNRVCLDMLEKVDATDVSKFEGWSSAYTVQSILIQLQSFLFEAEVSKVLKDISNPKDYEKKKKEWLSGVTWSVEQSKTYSDKSVGHFPPRSPWPPLPEEKDLSATSQMKLEQLIKDELSCFYTRQSFEEDCLGYGISYSKNLRTGEIKSIQSPLDLVSLRAYMNQKLRFSANNEKFTHYLPIYINEKHGEKAMYLAKRSISIICTGHHGNFEPKMVLEILPKLMSTMVVEVMSGKKHASLKALRGYCFFHRMLLQFVKEYPELKTQANQIVSDFIKDDAKRHKENGVPNLGEFLTLIPITDYKWTDVKDAYVQESFTRNVFWLLNKYPELEEEDNKEFNDDDRLKYSFDSSKTSQKLLMFHVFFLNKIAKPDDKSVEQIAKDYDENYGRPTSQFEDLFISACESINECQNYEQFFESIGKPISKEDIVKLLKSSIKASKEKGYHGSKASVLSPEQFAKENRPVDLEKMCTKDANDEYVLESDEEKWRSMSELRWGLDSLPEYLNGASNPWRKLYLQNNLQDLISNLNDVPDLPLLHKTVELSAEIPRLEIAMFNPTNIKSKYFFLTVLLTKLKQLNTLIIKKGETGLGTNGFKALVKGLANNPGTLEALILEFCDINARSIEELTKGKLVSGNLRKLVLRGNPLEDKGAQHLGAFLRQHSNLPHLTELDLSDCRINHAGANSIAEALLVKKELKKLNMIKNPCNAGLETIFKNLAYSPSIVEFNASRSNASFRDSGLESVKKLLQLSVSLEKLNLWSATGIGSISATVFTELETNTSLKELDLDSTGYNNIVEIGKSLRKNTTLEKLCLGSNNISSTHIFNFLEELKKGSFSVQHLDLSNNAFNSRVKEKHMHTIGQLIELGKKLTYVNLASSKIGVVHMETIGEALKPQHGLMLKTLILKRNDIGKYGVKHLVEALKVNQVLETLDLSGNDIGVLGSQSVAAFMKHNKSIKTLNLFGNLIEIEGALCMADALKSNTTLTDLDLGLNRIRARGAAAIADLLSVNKTLTRIGLKHNHINDKTGLKLANAIVDNAQTELRYVALAGNFLSVPTRSDIAVLFSQKGPKGLVFDLAKLVEVKDPERMERTIYVSPLPGTITEQQIKKLFYQNKCGVCLNVSIHTHKTNAIFKKSKYAFLEFAHVDSVALAMRLCNAKKNYIAGNEVRIVRAGIQQKDETTEKVAPRGGVASRGRGSAPARRGRR